MKRATKTITYLFSLLLMGSVFTACQDKSNEPLTKKEVEANQLKAFSVDVDRVSNVFYGETAWLESSGSEVSPYLLKRLPNIASTITEKTEVIVLDEAMAGSVMNDPSTLNQVKAHWAKNKPVAFVNPSKNTIQFISLLNGVENSSIDNESVKLIEQYAFYMLQRDGNAVSYCKLNLDPVTVAYTDTLTNELQSATLLSNEVELSESEKGRVGERAAEWLAAMNATRKNNGLLGDVNYQAFKQKMYYTIRVNHDDVIEKMDYKIMTPVHSRTTEVCVELTICAGYNQSTQQDVYDVVISETYDAAKSYVEDQVFRTTNGLFFSDLHYKYTGGNCAGMKVGLSLMNVNQGDVSFYQAVPVGVPGAYSSTHTSGSFNVSGSVTGLFPGGNMDGGLSFAYTPASTTVSLPHSDMPLQFNDNHNWAEWVYGVKKATDYPRVYDDGLWGFDADFIGAIESSTRACRTEQALTFMVSNSDKYQDTPISLKMDIECATYHEVATPYTHAQCFTYHPNRAFVVLPSVYRHFEKYSPYCDAMKVVDNTESWTDVENVLKSNVNYKVFCNDNLLVGAITADGVENAANAVWRETIDSIMNQFQHRTFKNEYVVALSRTNGVPLKSGMHIKDGKITLVEDINVQ
jgi:hypothetical protein